MDTYLTLLRENGYKITPLRKAILDAFIEKRASLTAERLCKLVRTSVPNAGLQSIYRNLADFTQIGIVEEIFTDQRKTAYALCDGISKHHHHAVCRHCSRAVEVNACELGSVSGVLSRSLQKIRRKTGFLIEKHFLQLQGLCDACQS